MNQVTHHDGLVSCLMVTLPVRARSHYFKTSIEDYCRQTYTNRELVVVMDRGTAEGRAAALHILQHVGRDDIRVIDPPEQLTLGALRNISWREATGGILCQWDDDDRHHPQRVEHQLSALSASGRLSVCLQEVMQYFPQTRRLYLTNWLVTPQRMKAASIICLKTEGIHYPETGPEARIGEDHAVWSQFETLGGCHGLSGMPHLYIYTSHDHNISGDEMHQMILQRLGVSAGFIRRREAALRSGLASIDFGPGVIDVRGLNGPAFTLGTD